MAVYLQGYQNIHFNGNIVREYISTASNQACSSSKPRIDNITFYFSYKKIIREYWLSDTDSSIELVFEEQQPGILSIIRFNYQTLLNSTTEQETIKDELRGWHLPEDRLQGLIDDVLCQTRKYIGEVRPGYNGLKILIKSTAVYDHIFRRSDAIDLLTRLHSIGESASNNMVPATDSSLKLLKSKIMDCANENCSICFEEFSSGSEALCMPCSHVFHGVCIEKWLRTSHYCPICRYEMPTI